MRFALLLASLISALIAAALGFHIIELNDQSAADVNHLVAAWASWSFFLYVAAALVGERP